MQEEYREDEGCVAAVEVPDLSPTDARWGPVLHSTWGEAAASREGVRRGTGS